ncbi:MAG: beta-L-arabinofuranosidase domain-containing protein [Bacteroidota bacterium]
MKIKIIFLLIFAFASINHFQTTKDYAIRPVQLKHVNVDKGFWYDRIATNRSVTIPYVFQKLDETGRINNLLFAAGINDGEFCTAYAFDDSDVYKAMEAVCYSLVTFPDKAFESKLDSLISVIEKAQEEDGYLYSARRVPSEKVKKMIGPERWSNLQWSHELYNLGHLYEAAAAHYQATGKKTLLNVAIKSAELIEKTFGPGKLQIPPGHQEIEIGLVKLYKVTGEEKYLKLAKFFLDIRGRGKELNGRDSWGEYAQDHKPVIEQDEAVGHAVRASYMFSAMADAVAFTGDENYRNALNKLWENVVSKKIYITGGIGAKGSGEAFGDEYELPNMSAYNETCSSIANMLWNYRMFLLYGESKYIDVFERTLYNGFLSGIGMDGKSFFYPNPLQSYGTHVRSPWFTCACCPPNIARFIASFPSFIYAVKDENVFINLFASNSAAIDVNGKTVRINQETDYPWGGEIKITVNPEADGNKFKLNLRIPGWAKGKPIESDLYSYVNEFKGEVKILINGNINDYTMQNGYAVIERDWNRNDEVSLILPMQINRIIANGRVESDKNKVALEYGPVVYCAEWPDSKDGYVRNLLLTDESELKQEYKADLLNGINVIKGKIFGCKVSEDEKTIIQEEQDFNAIPYYAWAHRGAGEMNVWLGRNENGLIPVGKKTIITRSSVAASNGKNIKAVNDQIEPASSNDESVPFFHWWPNKGTKEWVEINFDKPEEISQVEIYWFDDTGDGECRIPKAWKVFYMEGDKYIQVYAPDGYEIEKDGFCKTIFETVKTSKIKIEIESQAEFAGGIHEIKIK